MPVKPFVILYVEDNDLVRESIAELLANADREVLCASDGAGARDVWRERRVDVLLTDINLPDGSGLDLVREMLQQKPHLPVIVCSGQDMANVTGLLGPTARLLKKPFEVEELEALLDRLGQ